MPTLYLSAPKAKTQQAAGFYKDFYTILASGKGPDYAISSNLIGQVCAGIKVVVFDRDRRLRAEGVVTHYSVKGKAGNGITRYDVYIRNLTPVSFSRPPRVNRSGVAVV